MSGKLEARTPKKVFMVKCNDDSIYFLYPAPTFDNKIDVEKEDVLPFALALIGEADIEELLKKFNGSDRQRQKLTNVEFYLCRLYLALKDQQALKAKEADDD